MIAIEGFHLKTSGGKFKIYHLWYKGHQIAKIKSLNLKNFKRGSTVTFNPNAGNDILELLEKECMSISLSIYDISNSLSASHDDLLIAITQDLEVSAIFMCTILRELEGMVAKFNSIAIKNASKFTMLCKSEGSELLSVEYDSKFLQKTGLDTYADLQAYTKKRVDKCAKDNQLPLMLLVGRGCFSDLILTKEEYLEIYDTDM